MIDGISRVTAKNWNNFEKYTTKGENEIWYVDNIIDNMDDNMNPVILNVGNSSPSDDEDD